MEKEFLEILRTLSQTVFVLSANNDQERHAMTVSSVASLSLKPPSMMVGVNKEASINGVLEKNSNFCLNLLKKSQQNIADTCSGTEEGEKRFTNDLWVVRDQADTREGLQKIGLAGGADNVAHHGEAHANASGSAIDRGDHRHIESTQFKH